MCVSMCVSLCPSLSVCACPAAEWEQRSVHRQEAGLHLGGGHPQGGHRGNRKLSGWCIKFQLQGGIHYLLMAWNDKEYQPLKYR